MSKLHEAERLLAGMRFRIPGGLCNEFNQVWNLLRELQVEQNRARWEFQLHISKWRTGLAGVENQTRELCANLRSYMARISEELEAKSDERQTDTR